MIWGGFTLLVEVSWRQKSRVLWLREGERTEEKESHVWTHKDLCGLAFAYLCKGGAQFSRKRLGL
jgi:hypothetical protein